MRMLIADVLVIVSKLKFQISINRRMDKELLDKNNNELINRMMNQGNLNKKKASNCFIYQNKD